MYGKPRFGYYSGTVGHDSIDLQYCYSTLTLMLLEAKLANTK